MATPIFFEIVTRILQEDILAPYLFIIGRDEVLRTSIDLLKENGFTLKKKKLESDYIQQKLS